MSREFDPYQFPIEQRNSPSSKIESEVIHVEGEGDLPPWFEGDAPTEPSEPPMSDEEREEAEAEAEAEAKRKAREANPFWQFISGNWLILQGTTGTYRYLICVAIALFLSVVSIFYSFHLGAKYSSRERSVQLLRERSLEYQRLRFNKTSHSAIVKELKARNIPIYDMQESKTIIEK